VAAKLGATVCITDRADAPEVQTNCTRTCALNGVADGTLVVRVEACGLPGCVCVCACMCVCVCVLSCVCVRCPRLSGLHHVACPGLPQACTSLHSLLACPCTCVGSCRFRGGCSWVTSWPRSHSTLSSGPTFCMTVNVGCVGVALCTDYLVNSLVWTPVQTLTAHHSLVRHCSINSIRALWSWGGGNG
jgi:hypothetical protein